MEGQAIQSKHTLGKTYNSVPFPTVWQQTCTLTRCPVPSRCSRYLLRLCLHGYKKSPGPNEKPLRSTKLKRLAVLCLLAVPLASLSAHADTIGPNCGSCFGSTYTLTETATSNPNVFDIKLVVDASGYTGTSTNFLNAVSLKVVSQSSDIAGCAAKLY